MSKSTENDAVSRYNGWTNYETWAVKLWIDNEEGLYRYWQDTAQEVWSAATGTRYAWETREDEFVARLAEQLKADHEENTPTVTGVYADLLNAALGEVNWREIAATYLEDLDRSDEERHPAGCVCADCAGADLSAEND